jgi:hypothetical protein
MWCFHKQKVLYRFSVDTNYCDHSLKLFHIPYHHLFSDVTGAYSRMYGMALGWGGGGQLYAVPQWEGKILDFVFLYESEVAFSKVIEVFSCSFVSKFYFF